MSGNQEKTAVFIVQKSKILAADRLHEPLELRQGLLDLKPELSLGQVVVSLVLEHVHRLEEQFPRLEQGLPELLGGQLSRLPRPLAVLQQRKVELVEGDCCVDLEGNERERGDSITIFDNATVAVSSPEASLHSGLVS